MQIKKLERALNGIWSGELPHYQGLFVCGSSKCLAGWIFSLENNRDSYPNEVNTWFSAQEILGISRAEAMLLFNSKCTRKLHELVLEAFRKGRRLELKHDNDNINFFNNFLDEEAYNSPELTLWSREMDKISEFLGTELIEENYTICN